MKQYIGDGVYVEIIYGQLVVTTEDGIKATNMIVFEPEVLAEFLAYCNKNLREAEKVTKFVDNDKLEREQRIQTEREMEKDFD